MKQGEKSWKTQPINRVIKNLKEVNIYVRYVKGDSLRIRDNGLQTVYDKNKGKLRLIKD